MSLNFVSVKILKIIFAGNTKLEKLSANTVNCKNGIKVVDPRKLELRQK